MHQSPNQTKTGRRETGCPISPTARRRLVNCWL
jgi:hypothetical protein